MVYINLVTHAMAKPIFVQQRIMLLNKCKSKVNYKEEYCLETNSNNLH